jgi:integrase
MGFFADGQGARIRALGRSAMRDLSPSEKRPGNGFARRSLEDVDPLKERREAAILAAAETAAVKTVKEVLVVYSRSHLTDLKTGTDVHKILLRDLAPILNRDIRSITGDDILAILAAKYDSGKRRMSNLLRAYASGLFNFAVTRRWVDKNPVADVKRLHKQGRRGRERVLSDREIGAFLRALDKCEGAMARACRMLLMSGCRKSEVANMVWAEVDLREGKWTLPGSRSKNGQPHITPLVPRMLDDNVLRPGFRTGECVFASGRIGDRPINGWTLFKPRIDALMKEKLGKLEPWHVHDLRRSFATAISEHGADRHLVSLLLNHTDGHVTGTYDRLPRLEERRRVLEWWSDRLEMLKNLPPSGNIVELKRAAAE